MTGDGEKTYEMFWDCEYCGTRKLLGKSQRHCPECGAAQNPEKRYFPEEDEKVAVEDHVYVGADVHCPACEAPNSAAAKFCCECGSPLEGAGSVALVEDAAAAPASPPGAAPAPAPAAAAPPVKKKGKAKKIALAVILLLVVGFVLLAIFWTETVAITTTGHTWQREIKIEDFRPRNKNEWCNLMPTDAYSVSRTKEIRSYKDVPDGQDCSMQRVDNGDGTYKQKRVCTTKYRKEPVYDQKCHFTVDRWEYARSATASGRSLAETPVWPTFKLKKGRKAKAFGAEREGQHVETYTVHFLDVEGKTKTCNYPEASWRGIVVNSRWQAEASVITGLLDCATLRPPDAE